jgi:SNF2 family DNA or RNA helicase
VAALLFVTENIGEQAFFQYQKQAVISLPASNRNRINSGYEIPNYQHIDIDFVRRNTSPQVLSQLTWYGDYTMFGSVEILPESVTFISGNINTNVKFFKDESQAIKNPVLHRYKAACLIHARNKIALTGTPIENSTFDLFAQMNFVSRGFLGSVQKFRKNYSTPIDEDGDELIAGELNRLTHPFVLRRTKEMVASELPEKTENILYCEMESGQRRVYDAYRNECRNRLLNKIEEEGIGKSKMMGLIRDELAKLNIEYEYLDGQSSSKQREQSVNNFQGIDNLRVFLISLKAGGTGLNLTAADYVYIVDPWWNPAVENQAIDRCHRIGQDKKVFAYRMICKNTVEEKIMALQQKKKKITGDIIQTDESILKKLNKNDINELFS